MNLVNAGTLAKARGHHGRRAQDAQRRRLLLAAHAHGGGGGADRHPRGHRGQRRAAPDAAPGARDGPRPVRRSCSSRHHRDRPGTVGRVGALLGAVDVNISAMNLARSAPRAEAYMVLALDDDVPPSVVDAIQADDAMIDTWVDPPGRRPVTERLVAGPPAAPTRRSSPRASTRRSSCCATASPSGSSRTGSRARARRRCPRRAAARRRSPGSGSRDRTPRRRCPCPPAGRWRSSTPRWPARPRPRRPWRTRSRARRGGGADGDGRPARRASSSGRSPGSWRSARASGRA